MKPKLEALRIAEVKLQDAQKELEAAESKLQDCQDVLTKLQSKFEAQMAKKRAIEDNAARTRSRMEQVRRMGFWSPSLLAVTVSWSFQS